MKALIKNKKGQATVELALILPFMIWLIFYTTNAFLSIHTAHIGQKYAAMNLNERLDHRSKIIIDDVDGRIVQKEFMAVKFTDNDGKIPVRRIISGNIQIKTTIGICREPACN